MPELTVTELREQVRQLLALVAEVPDRDEKRKLASRAFALAQHAESIQRIAEDGLRADADPNFQIVTESNVQRFVGQLYVEHDLKVRELYRELAIRQETLYGGRRERLTLLMRLLQDCDGRMLTLGRRTDGERASGMATDGADRLMDNLIDTQRFLLQSLCQELTREI